MNENLRKSKILFISVICVLNKVQKTQMKPKINTAWLLPVMLMLCVGAGDLSAQTTASDQAFNAGVSFFSTGNYTTAISTWENLLTNDPNYQEKDKVWYHIAAAAIKLRKFDIAVNYLDKIIDQRDANGNLLRGQGQYYSHSLFLIGQTLFEYAELLSQESSLDKLAQARQHAMSAKTYLDQLLEEFPASPNVPQSLHSLTQIAVKYMKSAAETRKYTEMALTKIPQDTEENKEYWANCRFYHAWVLAQGQPGEVDEARRIFSGFIQTRDPKRGPMSLHELAFTYYQMGDFQTTLNELSRYKTLFPLDKSATLNIERLQAMCFYHLEYYVDARKLMEAVITQQESQNMVPRVEDQVFMVLCYIKNREFESADGYIKFLENKYASTAFADGLMFLRGVYHAEMGQYQEAANLIWTILGVTRNTTTDEIVFTKLPRNMETAEANKSGLSEEYYLRAASQLAICYAKSGNTTVAWQVYNAMLQVSNEMYGRFASIRTKTQQQLNEIEKSLASGTTQPPVIGGNLPPVTTYPPGSTTITSGSQSTVQVGSSNNLGVKELSPAEQDEIIRRCQTQVEKAAGIGDINQVFNDLNLLMYNPHLSAYNEARVAILRGKVLYEYKDDAAQAVYMADLAYKRIMESRDSEDRRNTETFVQAARGLGRKAESEGNYSKAAEYYSEALDTKVGDSPAFRAELLYRLGTVLLNIRSQGNYALSFFEEIDRTEKTSDYWSHAALQLAIADYHNSNFTQCEKTVDEIIAFMPDRTILDRVLYLKGELAMRNKQWDIAVDAFDAIAAHAPPSSPFRGPAAQKRIEARGLMR